MCQVPWLLRTLLPFQVVAPKSEVWLCKMWGADKPWEQFSCADDKAAWMPRKLCTALLLGCCPLPTPLTLFLVLAVSCHHPAAFITGTDHETTLHLAADSLGHSSQGSWLMGSPHRSFPRHGYGLLSTWYNCQAYCDPSWREPWSSFPWLPGGGCLSSPRPSNGSLGWLRGCHQLLEFLDSTLKSPSQRNWLLVSWVSDSWDSQILQLGRFI